jgi:hypothetical protein
MRNNQSDIKRNVSRGFQNKLHTLTLRGHVLHNYAGDVRTLRGTITGAPENYQGRHTTETVTADLTMMCARESGY